MGTDEWMARQTDKVMNSEHLPSGGVLNTYVHGWRRWIRTTATPFDNLSVKLMAP